MPTTETNPAIDLAEFQLRKARQALVASIERNDLAGRRIAETLVSTIEARLKALKENR